MFLCELLEWPVFIVCHGDTINFVLFCLTGLRENRRHPATYLVHGAKALNNAFRGWTRKEVSKSYSITLLFTFSYIILSSLHFLFLPLGFFPSVNNWSLPHSRAGVSTTQSSPPGVFSLCPVHH